MLPSLGLAMRQGKREWTEADSEKLKALVRSGASFFRASVALGRSTMQVRKERANSAVHFPTSAA